MEPALGRKNRPDIASLFLFLLGGFAVACVLVVVLVWPFAILFVAVSPGAAYVFVAGCLGLIACGVWWFVRNHRMGDPSP